MNTVGINYERSISVLCVREGEGPPGRIVPVGDGWRRLVPNAVSGEERWGSEAFSISAERRFGGDHLAAGPWLDAPHAALFWRHLAGRLYSFLGRTEPVRENGYRVVVALSDCGFPRSAASVSRLAAEAGLKDVTCISVLDALLCRWAFERPFQDKAERTVVIVNVGDTVCDVGARRVRLEGGDRARAVASGRVTSLQNTGLAWWLRRITELVRARLREPIPPGQELAIRDAVIEFGLELGRAGGERAVEWTGPFRELMFAPPRLHREECRAWPEVANLEAELPDAIRRSLRSLGAEKADVVLLGGVGAALPFAASSVGGLGPVWHTPDPLEDGARGAAMFSASLSASQGAAGEELFTQEETREPAAAEPRRAELPPWERRELSDER